MLADLRRVMHEGMRLSLRRLYCPLNVLSPHSVQGINKELAYFWGTFFSRQILHGPVNQDGFTRPISSHQSSCIMHFL